MTDVPCSFIYKKSTLQLSVDHIFVSVLLIVIVFTYQFIEQTGHPSISLNSTHQLNHLHLCMGDSSSICTDKLMYRGIVVSYMVCWKLKKNLYILQYKHRDELQNNKFKSYQFIF